MSQDGNVNHLDNISPVMNNDKISPGNMNGSGSGDPCAKLTIGIPPPNLMLPGFMPGDLPPPIPDPTLLTPEMLSHMPPHLKNGNIPPIPPWDLYGVGVPPPEAFAPPGFMPPGMEMFPFPDVSHPLFGFPTPFLGLRPLRLVYLASVILLFSYLLHIIRSNNSSFIYFELRSFC